MKIFILLIICGIEFSVILWGAYRMVRINGTAKVIQEALDEWYEEEKEQNRILKERSREAEHENRQQRIHHGPDMG